MERDEEEGEKQATSLSDRSLKITPRCRWKVVLRNSAKPVIPLSSTQAEPRVAAVGDTGEDDDGGAAVGDAAAAVSSDVFEPWAVRPWNLLPISGRLLAITCSLDFGDTATSARLSSFTPSATPTAS